MTMSTIDRILSVCFGAIAIGYATAFIATGDLKYATLDLGALAVCLLFRIAADVGERR